MNDDLCALRDAVRRNESSAGSLLNASLSRADASTHVFIRRFDAQARAAAGAVDALRAAGGPVPPLAGIAVSVKDLFDVAGFVATAGSQVFDAVSPATADSGAVARLRAAGAALIGHTNMTEFAYSGVGINPHHGTPSNPALAGFDEAPRIPGGSTSGGAVSVALGAAHAALGSDTGGSIRIPAALQGLVGFKNTARLTPTDGAVPLSTTLDTACAITRSVRDAVVLHEVLAQRRVTLKARPLHAMRFAVPTTTLLDGLDSGVAEAFESALRRLRALGAQIEDIPLQAVAEPPTWLTGGGFTAAESFEFHRDRLARPDDAARIDPRVASRLRNGASMSAADYIGMHRHRRSWISSMNTAMRGYEAMLSPTVPIEAPRIADLVTDDAAFATANARLLRNPSVVNILDGCALSLPCHAPGTAPVGLMVWGAALWDDTILEASLAIEAALGGATH